MLAAPSATPGVSTDPARGPETTGTNREQRAKRRAVNVAQARPARHPHNKGAAQQMAADLRKRQRQRYFSSWRAITTRWIWLVPS